MGGLVPYFSVVGCPLPFTRLLYILLPTLCLEYQPCLSINGSPIVQLQPARYLSLMNELMRGGMDLFIFAWCIAEFMAISLH